MAVSGLGRLDGELFECFCWVQVLIKWTEERISVSTSRTYLPFPPVSPHDQVLNRSPGGARLPTSESQTNLISKFGSCHSCSPVYRSRNKESTIGKYPGCLLLNLRRWVAFLDYDCLLLNVLLDQHERYATTYSTRALPHLLARLWCTFNVFALPSDSQNTRIPAGKATCQYVPSVSTRTATLTFAKTYPQSTIQKRGELLSGGGLKMSPARTIDHGISLL